MSLDLAKYQAVKYDDTHYNCLHFAVDIYRDITGKDIGLYVGELMTGKNARTINPSKLKDFIPLDTPRNPCLAVMHGQAVHAGIFYHNQIIHLTEAGIQCVPPHIAQLQHGKIRYYDI